MTYVRKHKEVEAIRLNSPVYDKNGKQLAPAGYWLIIDGEEQHYMTDEDFRKEYTDKEYQQIIPIPTIPTPLNPRWDRHKITCTSDKIPIEPEYFCGDLPPGKFVFVEDVASDRIPDISDKIPVTTDYFCGDLPPSKFVFMVEDALSRATNIDKLCKSMHIYTSDLASSDLRVSFSVV